MKDLPQPYRAFVWIITAISAFITIYATMHNMTVLMVIFGIIFLVFGFIGFFWGLPDLE